MKKFFKRQIELWGEDTQEKLQEKSIAIIGCGGLGCSLGLALGASGVGRIDLIDFDKISLHNIHRQIAFSLEDIGKHKAETLKKLIKSRCDFIKVNSYIESFEDYTKKDIKVDLILDATDNIPTRIQIDDFAKKTKTPWIYSSVEEFNGQVCFFQNAKFDSIFKTKEHIPKGQIAPMVMFLASFEANLALRYLANLEIVKDRLNYLFFDKDGFSHKAFKLSQIKSLP